MSERKYNMKSVTLLTGINEHTLRAWETRYQAIVPSRTVTGRREYSQSDIERIRSLMTLSENGHSISYIAGLTPGEISRLSAETTNGHAGLKVLPSPEPAVAALLALIADFNLPKLQALLKQCLTKYGAKEFIFRIVSPMMSEIGAKNSATSMSIAQEHAASSIIKAALFEVLFSFDRFPHENNSRNETLIFATMEGDHHEFGILCAAILAKLQGFNCVYLGANTPAESLAVAADALNATDIIIGSVDIHTSLLKYQPEAYIDVACAILKKQCRIVLGTSLGSLSGKKNLTIVNSLTTFAVYLDKLASLDVPAED